MGRKETHYLHTFNCDIMAQQGIKVRPVLLKRNSLDSVDFHHRRSKSQQVRFKDDGTDNPPLMESDMETSHTQDSYTLDKMQTSQTSNQVNNCLDIPSSHNGLQNIAIQTSPSLRKHFPIFKKKRITATKSLSEMPTESEYSNQENGNLYEQAVNSSSLFYLSIGQRLGDRPRAATTTDLLSERVPKEQSNGPIYLGSDKFPKLEKVTVSTQEPEYTHHGSAQDNFSTYGPDTQMDLTRSVHSSTALRQSDENCSVHTNSEKSFPCASCNCNETNVGHGFCKGKNYTEPLASSDCNGTKEIISSSPQLCHSSLFGSLREHQQPIQQKTDSDHKTLTNNNQTIKSFINNSAPSCPNKAEDISTDTKVPQYDNYLEDFHINAYLPEAEIKPQNKDIKPINQIHLAHSELCALQDRLHSVEESLQSNQEKIKILLNVIQDMERPEPSMKEFPAITKICCSQEPSPASNLTELLPHWSRSRQLQHLPEHSMYHLQVPPINGVEHDFRQQEGRFQQVLKTLDRVEQGPPGVSLQRQPSDHHPAPEKQALRRRSRKRNASGGFEKNWA